MKVIVNLICLDSAPELPALLDSLKGRVDALVAVDGVSSDNTVALLERWGRESGTPVVVRQNPWPDDFALQRNLCLETARARYGTSADGAEVWVLAIDSDDTLVEFDREFVEKACGDGRVPGLLCRMDNGNGFFNVCQMFRLDARAVWRNPIHEHVELAGGRCGQPPKGALTIKRGRSARHDSDPGRNVRIGRRFVEECPDDSRARFYLARDILECGCMPPCQARAEAEGHLRMYLAMRCGYVAQDRYARLLLAKALADGGRAGEARAMLLDSLADDPDNRSAYEALSRLSTAKQTAEVWRRLASAAAGGCVLPYGAKLPKQIGPD